MTLPRETYTHGHHESVLRSHTWRTAQNFAAYLLQHLRPGVSLLDVGCGPGTITIDLCACGSMPAVRGGIVAARDGDYEAFIWYADDPRLDRWLELYRLAARANGGEPDAGRRLLAWAHEAGFADVTATASV
jgi:hypothetical protein